MPAQPTLIYGDTYILTAACQKCQAHDVSCVSNVNNVVCLQCIATAAYRHEGGAQKFHEQLSSGDSATITIETTGEIARRYAVTITMVEQAFAYFLTYIACADSENGDGQATQPTTG